MVTPGFHQLRLRASPAALAEPAVAITAQQQGRQETQARIDATTRTTFRADLEELLSSSIDLALPAYRIILRASI